MMKTGRVLGAALVCFLASPLVMAQTSNLAVVCDGSGTGCANFTGIPSSQVFSDIASAMTYITPLSKTAHCTVLIGPGTFALGTGIKIDSTMDLEIVGTSASSLDDPTAVILQGNSSAYGIELDGALDTVLIEGLTITGAKAGVWAHNSSKGTVARCFINGSAGSGILIEGSDLFVANCSLKGNATDGVTISGAGGTGEIYFCTIYTNGEHGVHADAASSASIVQDCIVYQNGVSGASADAGGIVGASASVFTLVDTNDSVGNKTGADYVPAGLGTNPVSAAPAFDTAFTWGALDGLDTSNITNIIGHAVTPSVSSDKKRFVDVDFQSQGRPAVWPIGIGLTASDIGADEVSAGGGIPLWDYCYVATNPIPKMVAGTLTIQLRFSGGSPALATGDAIIVPQGTTTAGEYSGLAGTPHIPLKVVAPNPVPTGGSSFYILTNANDITTSLGAAASSAGPSASDVIADGHGVVHVRVGGTEIPAVNIIGQAINGRHVLIDTTPPRLYIASPSGVLAPGFVQYVAPIPSVGPPGIPDGNHAGLPAFSGPGTVRVYLKPSYDDGLIYPVSTTGVGAQAFFNPGSVSNGYLAANGNPSQLNNLNIQVSIAIQDLPPLDVTTGNEILGTDETYSPLTPVHRQVIGFGNPLPTNKTQESVDTALTGTPGPNGRLVDWVFDTGALPTSTKVNTTYSALAGGSNVGYVPASGTTQDFNNARLSVTWTFDDPTYPYVAGAPTGIPYSGADSHMAVRFRVRDSVNTATTQSQLLDPLHLWWMLNVRARIQPNREGTEVVGPDFTWALDRSVGTNVLGQPRPLFAYRIWENLTNDYNGEYVPITGWSSWSTTNRLTAQDFTNLNIMPSHADRWLLVAVVGSDEAGNVEQWPLGTGLTMNASEHLLATTPSGANWQRFFLKGANSGVLDTTITAQFWHDTSPLNDQMDTGEPTFQGFIVPSPQDVTRQRLEGSFKINLIGGEDYVKNSPVTAKQFRKVRWELVRENDSNKIGGDIVVDDPSTGTPHNETTVILPDGVSDTSLPSSSEVGELVPGRVFSYNLRLNLGDSHTNADARRPVSYVLRAWTYVSDTSQVNPVAIDLTPATFRFTVVPKISDYIQNKNNTDFQPVKVQEDK